MVVGEVRKQRWYKGFSNFWHLFGGRYGKGLAEIQRAVSRRSSWRRTPRPSSEADNDVVIDNQAISGHHAVIRKEGDELLIEDLEASNGTMSTARSDQDRALRQRRHRDRRP